MKNVYPIIFSFGNTKIPRNSIDTYKDFIKELFKELDHSDIEIPGTFPLTIRLKEHDKNSSAGDLTGYIETALKSKKLITDETEPILNYIKDKIIVIDFLTTEAIDSKNEFHFLYFIDSLLERSKNVNEPLKLVLIANRVYDELIFDNPTFFEKYVQSGQVVLFDNSGATYKNLNDKVSVFKAYRKLIFGDAYELFKRKLIGRVGHFKRRDSLDNHTRCHLFFYDGSHCQDELKIILREKFFEFNPDFVIYDCPESSWLLKAIQIATPYYSTTTKQLTVIAYSRDSKEISDFPKGAKGILIFDLVHKGNRLKEVCDQIKKLNPDIAIDALSILKATNSVPVEVKDTVGNLSDILNGIEYKYIHRVFQRDYLTPNGCKMCYPYQIPETPKFDEIQSILQSYFFWLLFDDEEIGARYNFPEKDPPGYRNSLAIVPDFKNLLNLHGPYLAYKMKQYLEENEIKNINEYTFVCPEEDGAKEVGKSIGYFFDAEVIRIDKKDVKRIIDEGMDKKQIISEFKESSWISYLLEIEDTGKSKSAIVFDEFAISQNTLKNYSIVIEKFGFQVLCFFPLFLFEDLNKIDGKPLFSLYNFKLFSSNPLFNITS